MSDQTQYGDVVRDINGAVVSVTLSATVTLSDHVVRIATDGAVFTNPTNSVFTIVAAASTIELTSSTSPIAGEIPGVIRSLMATTNSAMMTSAGILTSPPQDTALMTLTGGGAGVTPLSSLISTASITPVAVASSTSSFPTGIRPSNTTSAAIAMKNSTNSRLSSGATAGIAIGCAIIGALIGALLVGIFMRRRNHKSRRVGAVYEGFHSRNTPERDQKGFVTDIAMTRPSGSIDSILPLPVETNYLIREPSTIKTLIREHVSEFYGTDHVAGQSTILARASPTLDEYTTSSPFQGSRQLLEAVADPRTRTEVLRYLIALVVLQNIEQSGNGASDPLLPLGTACCLGNMSAEGFDGSRSDYNKLRSKWRVLTGYLQEGHYKQQDFSEADDRTANVQSVCETLDTVLAAYAIPAREADRQTHLLQVVRRASAFGTILAAQPNAYRFFWDHRGGLVIFPSLLQESDENGTERRQPRELGECERARAFPQRKN